MRITGPGTYEMRMMIGPFIFTSPLRFHWSPGRAYLLPTYLILYLPTYCMKLSPYYLGGDRGGIIKVSIRSPVQAFSGVEMEEGS